MKKDVFIRTDGSVQSGLGHTVRCLALAQMLKSEFSVTFFCKEIPDSMAAQLEESGFTCKRIQSEADFFRETLDGKIVVIDGYHFDTTYQQQLKTAGAILVCIDDIHDGVYEADMIINHAPGITSRNYHAKCNTQYALGPDYALLRPAFLEAAGKPRTVTAIKSVLICFGGSDYKNLTAAALKVVSEYPSFGKIVVVTGPAYKEQESLSLLIQADNRVLHYNSISGDEMFLLMKDVDLAIVPSSGILMEAMATSCCIISGIYADNQKLVYENGRKLGYFIDAKGFEGPALKDAIQGALDNKFPQHRVIDGNSGKRLLNLFLRLDLKKQFRLREAVDDDLYITFDWASDPQLRAYSFQQEIITKEVHTSWFSEKVKDSNCLYLIAEVNKNAVGFIRFDIKEDVAVINYLISSKYQGQGFGQVLLGCGISYLVANANSRGLNFHSIVGYVMKPNIQSIRAFERFGFIKHEENGNFKFEMTIV